MIREMLFVSTKDAVETSFRLLSTLNKEPMWGEPAQSMLMHSFTAGHEVREDGESVWRVRFKTTKKFVRVKAGGQSLRVYEVRSWAILGPSKEVKE